MITLIHETTCIIICISSQFLIQPTIYHDTLHLEKPKLVSLLFIDPQISFKETVTIPLSVTIVTGPYSNNYIVFSVLTHPSLSDCEVLK